MKIYPYLFSLLACIGIALPGYSQVDRNKTLIRSALHGLEYEIKAGFSAEATAESIESGDYKVVRPFNIATKDDVSEAAQDFITYIMSADGQQIIEDNGYISVGDKPAYEAADVEGKVVVAGSSSVTPVMEKLAEGYKAVNDKVDIEVQQSDSTTGMTSAIDGLCDIGMASRDLKDSELEAGLTATVIAKDGIAVIVNNDSGVEELTSEQVKDVYTGNITTWEDLTK